MLTRICSSASCLPSRYFKGSRSLQHLQRWLLFTCFCIFSIAFSSSRAVDCKTSDEHPNLSLKLYLQDFKHEAQQFQTFLNNIRQSKPLYGAQFNRLGNPSNFQIYPTALRRTRYSFFPTQMILESTLFIVGPQGHQLP